VADLGHAHAGSRVHARTLIGADPRQYFDLEPAPGTPEAARVDELAAAIEVHEVQAWPIEAPDNRSFRAA
jgi:antitoxin component HigA of HigAB toxin-antitoxin module